MKKNIGFFGGTFDPLHLGHINLAIQLLEKTMLDEILFCPAMISPHKIDKPSLISPEHRLQMIKLAIDKIDRFSVSDIELRVKEVSYTVKTIEKLISMYPDACFRLILAKDTAITFHTWKDFEKIMSLAPLLIGCADPESDRKSFSFPTEEKNLIQINQMEMSSTEIRQRFLEKKYCGHLVPSKVLDYILKHRLYY